MIADERAASHERRVRTRSSRRVRLIAIPLGLAVLSVLLVGCTDAARPSSGQSASAARAAIAAIPGVQTVTVEVEKSVSGLQTHHRVITEVTLQQGATIPRSGRLIDELVAESWSVNEVRPDLGVSLRLITDPQIGVGPLAQQDGWSTVSFLSQTEPSRMNLAIFDETSINKRIGAWPIATPRLPHNLITTGQ